MEEDKEKDFKKEHKIKKIPFGKIISIIFSIAFLGLAAVTLFLCARWTEWRLDYDNRPHAADILYKVCNGAPGSEEVYSPAETRLCEEIVSGYDATEKYTLEVKIMILFFAGMTFIGIGFLGLKRK